MMDQFKQALAKNWKMGLVAALAAFVTVILGGSASDEDGFEVSIPVGESSLVVTGSMVSTGIEVCTGFDEDLHCYVFDLQAPAEDDGEESLEGTGEDLDVGPSAGAEEGSGEPE